MDVEIGRGKKARQAYGFDDIAIVPSRRTRDPQDVDIGWKLGPHLLELPLLGSAMDGVVSPQLRSRSASSAGSACSTSRASTRVTTNPMPSWSASRSCRRQRDRGLQEIYARPVEPKLIAERIEEIKRSGVLPRHRSRRSASRSTTRRARGRARHARHPGDGRLGRARLHDGHALNLKEFIATMPIPIIVGGCASYQTALHLMRTGAEGVLVGVGPGTHAPRAASLAWASRRRPRSPTRAAAASSICWRRAST